MRAAVFIVLFLILTTVSPGHCEPDYRGAVVMITGRRMLVAGSSATSSAVLPTASMRVPQPGRVAAMYSESKRSSPGGPDPQHH
ncbi:hypothetical protein PR202_gb17848 [Eleusine coracana subsp. coracana]|uniref:Uncharacterized protein n=1 Tax=Eleusine coracana subsp. coracana TaxID=191504 RepID=A0AAV5F440_ELECO|nr:hypothetical protein PR202_gb17848 [Eleusine coracana subsp. coracana]